MSITYDDLVSFHGHNCPGLASGYRMTKAAMNFLFSSPATDKKLVAIVEDISCSVDALQYLSGCTFGKRNLIFKDYGKQVYPLYDRDTKQGVRVAFNARNMLRISLKIESSLSNGYSPHRMMIFSHYKEYTSMNLNKLRSWRR